MTKGKRCPVCKSDVPLEARDCPNCPHTFIRDEYQRPKAKFGPGSWHPAIWVGILLVGILGIWRAIDFVLVNADPDTKNGAMEQFVDKQRIVVKNAQGEMKVISAGQQTDSQARQVAGKGYDAELAHSAVAAEPDLQTAMASETDEVTIDHSAPPPQAKEWRLRGMVYDLVTLAPIPHCGVFFTDPVTQSRYETSTDDSGSYRTIVPPLRGKAYTVTFEKTGYAHSYLDPGTENVPEMSAEDRKTLAAELVKSLDPPYDVQAAGAAPLKTDFYLAPTGEKSSD